MIDKYIDNALVFKALSDATRLKIIDMLSCDELCACVILEAFNITQPTLSYHMKMLTKVGLVNSRKEGSWVHYELNTDKFNELKGFLNIITLNKEDCICKRKDV